MSRAREQYPSHVEAAIAEAISEIGPDGERYHRVPRAVEFMTDPIPLAKGRIAQPRGMNQLERDYGGHLLSRRSVGEVLWYLYEGVTLKLADDTRYTPDWAVMLKNGELEMHEVKGPHRREDSIIKLRVAARLFPFRFYLVTRENNAWVEKEMTP